MINILFYLFTISFFMPSIAINGIALSDLFLIPLVYLIIIKIKFNKKESTIIIFSLIIILLYFILELIHIYTSLKNYEDIFFLPDRIAILYFFILIFLFTSLKNIITKDFFLKTIYHTVLLNGIILPYIFMFTNFNVYSKLSSLFVKPNQLVFFIITIPIILIILDYLKNDYFKYSLKINLTIFFLYLPILATSSKSGLLVFLLMHSIILIFYFKDFKKYTKIILSFLLIISIILFNPITFEYIINNIIVDLFPQFSRVAKFILSDDIQTQDTFRILNNKEGINIFIENYLFGIGYGTDIFLTSTNHEIHNTYIRLISCLGILYSIIFIIFNSYLIIKTKALGTNIIIYLFIPIFIYGIYHDIFTSKYYYILICILIYSILTIEKKEFIK